MMNRNLILFLLLLVLGGGAFYVYKSKSTTQGTLIAPDMDFSVRDTSSVTKIFIADRNTHQILLERKKDGWILNGKHAVRQNAIDLLLQTMLKQQVHYVPPKSAQKTMINGLATLGLKVEVYRNHQQKPDKVFYVGDVTPDELGTHMMIEGSEHPYVVHIPNFVGAVRGRYMVLEDDWKDRRVFAEEPQTIQRIEVEYPKQKSASFVLDRRGESFIVKPFYATQQTYPDARMRKGVADSYVLQFRSLTAEDFETYNASRDSVRALVPFCIISLTKTDGTMKQVRFHPQEVVKHQTTGEPYVFRYFADCSNGAFYLVQHRVFGNIFRGYDFFFDTGQNRILR